MRIRELLNSDADTEEEIEYIEENAVPALEENQSHPRLHEADEEEDACRNHRIGAAEFKQLRGLVFL